VKVYQGEHIDDEVNIELDIMWSGHQARPYRVLTFSTVRCCQRMRQPCQLFRYEQRRRGIGVWGWEILSSA